MAESLTLDLATLAGLLTYAILYGMFIILLIGCFYVLIYKRSTPHPNYALVTSSVLMFILITTMLALNFSRSADAFVFYRDAPGGPIAYLELPSQKKEVAITALTFALMFVGDSTLIYRCWIVWNKNYFIIAAPFCLLISLAVMGALLVVAMAGLETDASMFASQFERWVTAGMATTLAQNALVTFLIVFKIWKVNMSASHGGSSSLKHVIIIVVESGILYFATVFIFLVTYVSGSNAEYIMVSINPAIGIAFALLIVRVGLRRQEQVKTTDSGTANTTSSTGIRSFSVSLPSTWQGSEPDAALELGNVYRDERNLKTPSIAPFSNTIEVHSPV